MRVLVTAPYVGEYGWELMSWQARVRWLFERGRYDRLVVLGKAGKDAFYADMPLEYRAVDLSVLPGSAYEDRRALGPGYEPVPAGRIRTAIEPLVAAVVTKLQRELHEVEVLWPDYAGTIYPCEAAGQRFVRFTTPRGENHPAPWVLFVQRNRPVGAANWQPEQWSGLAEILGGRGIHTSVYSWDLATAIAAASHCDLAVGQSTGGLHLVSLCGCPHVAWWVSEPCLWTPWQITNRQRYETFWNPLATPVQYHEVGRQPEPEEVAGWVVHALETIGRRTGSVLSKALFRGQWSFKRRLARRVVRQESFNRWPWPIQRFVRYQLI